MRKALLVAKWEFLTTITRPGYIIVVIALPVLYGVMFALGGLATRSATADAGRIPTAIVDPSHVIDVDVAAAMAGARERVQAGDALATALEQSGDSGRGGMSAAASALAAAAPGSRLQPFATVEEAVAALAAGKVAAAFAIDANYLQTGKITAYNKDSGVFAQQGDQRRQNQVADAIRASLMRRSMSGEAAARAYAPTSTVERLHVTSAGAVEKINDPYGLGPLAGSLGVILLFTFSIFSASGFLQQATLADRNNRVIEVLISSVDPDELLVGKLIGLGGAGLLQVGIYVALIVAPGAVLFSIFQIPLARLLLALAFYVVGFTLFASLMVGTGMLGRTSQEAAQLSALWTLASAFPFFFFANIGAQPNGPVARALSFFPLTSPLTMIMRLGGADVPAADIAIALAVDGIAIVLCLRAASRIFRAATLMQGKRATLPEFLKWFRASQA